MKKTKQIFILGSGKSGTTLLQRIINSYSDVCIWGEHAGFLKGIAESYYNQVGHGSPMQFYWDSDLNKLTADDRVKLLSDYTHWQAWTNWYQKDDLKTFYLELLNNVFYPPLISNCSYWGFKEIRYGINDRVLEMLLEFFPDSMFLFIYRSPQEVIESQMRDFMRESSRGEFFRGCLSNWMVQNNYFADFCEQHPQNTALIAYKDLDQKPEDLLPKLFSYVGLPDEDKSHIFRSQEGRRFSDKTIKKFPLTIYEKLLIALKTGSSYSRLERLKFI